MFVIGDTMRSYPSFNIIDERDGQRSLGIENMPADPQKGSAPMYGDEP